MQAGRPTSGGAEREEHEVAAAARGKVQHQVERLRIGGDLALVEPLDGDGVEHLDARYGRPVCGRAEARVGI
jgi:hypothetical protein